MAAAPRPGGPIIGTPVGGGIRRRPGGAPMHIPKPKPTPGSLDRQGATSRGGLGRPRYGLKPMSSYLGG